MSETVADALATAVRAMLRPDLDVYDTLAALLVSGADALAVDAVGVFAVEDVSDLALLACSSHEPEVVRLLQETVAPGLDAVLESAAPVRLDGAAAPLVDVLAMRWHGSLVGATLVLRSAGGDAPDPDLAARLAETATLVVAQLTIGDVGALRGALHEALLDRDVVEQAKGLISYVRRVGLDEAYVELATRAGREDRSTTEVAAEVVRDRGRSLP